MLLRLTRIDNFGYDLTIIIIRQNELSQKFEYCPLVGGPPGQLSSQGNGTAFFAYDFCVLTQPTDFKYKLDVTDNVGQIDSKNLTITVVGFQSTDPSSNEGFQSIDPSSNEGFQSIDPNTDSGIQNDNLYSR